MSEKDIIHKLSSELDFERSKRKTLQMELQAKEQELTHFKKENERLLQTIIKDQTEIVQKNIDKTNILLIKENMDLQQQLQAKEQECEVLKKQYNCYACETCKGKEDYINLKRHCENAIKTLHNKHAELDQLKAENDTYKKMFEDEDVRIALTEIRSGERHLWFNKSEKLKQTLTEIKEIAEKQVKRAPNGEIFARPEITQILQKISEVKQ